MSVGEAIPVKCTSLCRSLMVALGFNNSLLIGYWLN